MQVVKSQLQILENTTVAENWLEMTLALPQEFSEKSNLAPLPGQFVSFSFPNFSFRRPFAVSNYTKEKSFSVLYQQVEPLKPYNFLGNKNKQTNNASSKMTKLSSGDLIDTMYFHGNSFCPPPKGAKAVLVAGGIGLGPLLYFQKELLARSYDTTLIFGARTKANIPLALLNIENIKFCTDDGSLGNHYTSIAMLEQLLSQYKSHKDLHIYFCGPLAMMKAGVALAEQFSIPSYSSLDCVMACAMGACVACVVPVYGKIAQSTNSTVLDTVPPATLPTSNELTWKKACMEGAVFRSEEIIWNQLNH